LCMHAEKALSKVDREYAKAIWQMNVIKNEMDRASEIYNVREEIARNALAKGASPEFVHEITGLPVETIEGL